MTSYNNYLPIVYLSKRPKHFTFEQSKFERDLLIVMLAFSICIPNVFSFLENLAKSVFGNKEWPSFSTILVVNIKQNIEYQYQHQCLWIDELKLCSIKYVRNYI